MSNHLNASIYSSIQQDSFSTLNFQRQFLQRRSAFGVSTPAAQFNQSSISQQSGLIRDGHPKIINGLPAEQWHSMSDERRKIFMQDKRKKSAFKTEMCKRYVESGFCDFGIGCHFAHSQHELRLRPVHPKFKSELCRNYAIHGSCVYGSRCQFIHRSPVKSDELHQLNNCAPSSRLLQQQLHSQFSQLGVSGVPKQPSVPQFSSSHQQMPYCVVCSGKENGKVLVSNPNV